MFEPGTKVSYQMNKRERGTAVVKSLSTAKRDHAYIITEREGTILVPLGELVRL